MHVMTNGGRRGGLVTCLIALVVALASAPWLPERRDEEEGYLNRTSHAVMQGTPLPVVAKLLGHSQTTMTLCCAHAGDRETEATTERIAGLISGLLGMSATT